MIRANRLAAAVLIALAAAPAVAEDVGPLGEVEIGPGFKLVELDQRDRDLNESSGRINVLFDVASGRSWVLRHTLLPGRNDQGYVWVEIPFAGEPRQP